MRLFSGKIPPLSDEIVQALVSAGQIETTEKKEVVRDVASVLEQYLSAERQSTEKAKDLLASRNLPQTEFPRIRKLCAEQAGIKVGDEMMDYLLDQIIEMLMHSGNVDEVFAADHDLRRVMRPLIKKHADVDAEVDTEVRGRLKHMQEGTRSWEIEYERIRGEIQRRKGLG
jgi:hypothetical protein